MEFRYSSALGRAFHQPMAILDRYKPQLPRSTSRKKQQLSWQYSSVMIDHICLSYSTWMGSESRRPNATALLSSNQSLGFWSTLMKGFFAETKPSGVFITLLYKGISPTSVFDCLERTVFASGCACADGVKNVWHQCCIGARY